MSRGLAAKFPLMISEEYGPYDLHTDIRTMVQQNLKMILLTNPGERMMDPDFGVGLQEFLHEPNTASLVGRISARIQSQVEEYMDFIEIQETYVGPDVNSLNPSDNVLAISIKYSIIPISEDDVLSITLSDFGL
tara:strand:+ start:2605 stop:3006 length:402 start_codon:yes stop_codon:yes gene_type:complete